MITWKTLNRGFFKGSEFRPATLNEKLAIAVLVGATLFLFLERLGWYFTGQLKVYF